MHRAITTTLLISFLKDMAGLMEGFPAEMSQRNRSLNSKGTDEEQEEVGNTNGNITANLAQRSSNSDHWLVTIPRECSKKLADNRALPKPRIQKVPELLRKIGSNSKHFDPEVVSLGPYHHGKAHLMAMEDHKKAAAFIFFNDDDLINVAYAEIGRLAGELRKSYAGDVDFNDGDLITMMFFDGCFVLHFIDCIVNDKMHELTMSAHLRGFITRDIFLFENQLPFAVLQNLMRLKPVKLDDFIFKVYGVALDNLSISPNGEGAGGDHGGPNHLLDIVHTKLLGKPPAKPPSCRLAPWRSFHSARELKEVGIRFKTSKTTRCLRDVKFKRGFLYSKLYLPEIVIDDLSRPRFLNLIAFEMCPNGTSDYGITSYICFLNYLIDHAADVKELREENILQNSLGSDQQVADLFNELATDLAPDDGAYACVIGQLSVHCKRTHRVSIVRMLDIHFRDPWTTIGFSAGFLLLFLTLVQTIFPVFAFFRGEKDMHMFQGGIVNDYHNKTS